jgi:hypothetical protein
MARKRSLPTRSHKLINPAHPKTRRRLAEYLLRLIWLLAGRPLPPIYGAQRRGETGKKLLRHLEQWESEARILADTLGYRLLRDQLEYDEVVHEMKLLLGSDAVAGLLARPYPWLNWGTSSFTPAATASDPSHVSATLRARSSRDRAFEATA